MAELTAEAGIERDCSTWNNSKVSSRCPIMFHVEHRSARGNAALSANIPPSLPRLPESSGEDRSWSYNESASPEWSCTLDIPNAFIGKTSVPSTPELSAALGSSLALWNELVNSLLVEPDITEMEWNCLKPKYGWNLIAKAKKRRIVYLGPCNGCFRVSFVLGDKAMAAARAGNFSKPIVKILDEAPDMRKAPVSGCL